MIAEPMTLIPVQQEWPTDLGDCLTRWRDAAVKADTLALAAKTEKAAAFLVPELPEGLKATDATREAYATTCAHGTAIRAAQAAAEAKALGLWFRYLLERELGISLPREEGAP